MRLDRLLGDAEVDGDRLVGAAAIQAVNYAIDGRALQRIFGGRLQPSCNFLPPGHRGTSHEKIDPCPYGDPNGHGRREAAFRVASRPARSV